MKHLPGDVLEVVKPGEHALLAKLRFVVYVGRVGRGDSRMVVATLRGERLPTHYMPFRFRLAEPMVAALLDANKV